jgi:alanine-synthesizing transaminase
MAGWRIGFMVGNKTLVNALARIKSYHDYGTFTPLQVAAIAALEGDQQCVHDIAAQYKRRRDVLVKGLHEAGWMVEMPKASMYVWAKIPSLMRRWGHWSLKKMLHDAKVCVSPGIGFGDYGDTHVRFALIENSDRIRQAVRGIKVCSVRMGCSHHQVQKVQRNNTGRRMIKRQEPLAPVFFNAFSSLRSSGQRFRPRLIQSPKCP